MKKTILIFIFSFFNTIIFAQHYNKKQIDSLLEVSYKHMGNVPDKTIPIDLEIIEASKKIGYTRGLAIAYTYIGKEYYNLNELKKAFIYAAKAEAEANIINESSILSDVFRLRAICFYGTGLYTAAKKELNKALVITNSIKDQDDKHRKRGFIYILMALPTLAKNDKQKDSILYYSKKSYNEFLNMKKETFLKNEGLSLATLRIGLNFIILKQNDSAEYYLKKSFSIANKIDDRYGKAYSLKSLGELYFIKQEYKQSIIYYNEAILEAKKRQLMPLLKDCYLGLSKVYNTTGNPQGVKKSLNSYVRLTDSITVLNNKIVDESIEHLIKEKEDDYKNNTHRLQRIKALLIGIIIITLVVLFFFYRKLSLEKLKRQKNTELLKNKEKKLQQLIEFNAVTLEEVLQLAKNKDASFFIKFQELYPDFIEKLAPKTEKGATLIHSELILCAMIKLGFTTKEIAQNLNSTVGAVETRKYRLRKKFNLVSSEEDLTIWMMNL